MTQFFSYVRRTKIVKLTLASVVVAVIGSTVVFHTHNECKFESMMPSYGPSGRQANDFTPIARTYCSIDVFDGLIYYTYRQKNIIP
jgi:hypothetical protein